VRARLEQAVQGAAPRRGSSPLVLDVPLLLEAHLDVLCDELWYIEVPEALRRQRAQARGLSPEALARWDEAQESAHAKRARATRTIRNDVAPAQLDLQIREALAQPAPA
jgi:dephospho-CoA kinase